MILRIPRVFKVDFVNSDSQLSITLGSYSTECTFDIYKYQ